ncbi:hypothetical protein [Bacillus phage PK1]|nr:hypothetical protein [Bacillus phage PK1]
MSKITADGGGMKISLGKETDDILNSILSAGMGLHTFYAVTGSKNLPPSGISIRGVAQLTTANFGWVWCIDYLNQMWTNYLDNNVWRGWERLITQSEVHSQTRLWSGVVYPDEGQTVKPTKKLSECRTGWILVWSDYDYGVGPNNHQWSFTFIPKTFAGYDAGGGMFTAIINGMSDTTITTTAKYLYVNDGDITGSGDNDSANNYANDVCLRYVYEF